MGKIIEQRINDFSGGMISNPRFPDFRYSQLLKNFDINLYPKRLYPVRDTESGDSAASTSKKQNFCLALRTGATYSIYALGVVSGDDRAEILYKDLTTTGNDLSDDGWVAPSATASEYQQPDATGATNFNLFVYYKKTGLIYGARNGSHIWTFTPATPAFDNTTNALTHTDIGQGLIHSKDDILYIPYDDGTNWKITKKDGTGAFTLALTLPAHYKITSLCEYGNYIAIACAPRSGIGNSRVYIWDRDSSLTTLTESIDWGEGNLTILEEIEGNLIGVSYVGNIVAASPVNFKGKIVLKQYSGGVATVFNQLIVDSNVVMDIFHKQKINQYLYFPLSVTLNGAVLRGIWRIGRNMSNEPFALSLYQFASNDSITTPLKGFFIVGDYVFVSYTDNAGTTYSLSKTNNSASYTATSIYESLIINGGDSRLKKDLLGITVTTDYLPAAGQVVLKYQTDANVGSTTWTTIFTNTTDDSISHSAVTGLPKDFKEIVFRIESTGGAVITGLEFKLEITGKDNYD